MINSTIKFLYLFFLCFILLFHQTSTANPTILIMGDSLSAAFQIPPEDGWVSLLKNKLKETNPTSQIINSSIVGDTTVNALKRLPSLLTEYHPDIVILELGGNDGLRKVPLVTIKENLKKMIKLSQKGQAKVLLIGMKLPPNYGEQYTQQFADIFTGLSREESIPLVPFLLKNVVFHPELMQPDRIHPSAKGQQILLDNIWPYLKPLL